MSTKTFGAFCKIALAVAIAPQFARAADDVALGKAAAPLFSIGAAVNDRQVSRPSPAELKAITGTFTSITSENELKPENLQREKGKFTFEAADRFVAFGEKHKMKIIGHCLVWANQTPAWMTQKPDGTPLSREEALANMKSHISTVVGRYKGRIYAWDVVNEAWGSDGKLRETPWFKAIGPDYVEQAFRFAREADPKAQLCYNEYNVCEKGKREAIANMVRDFKRRGVPIDAVGMQTHISLGWPSIWDYMGSAEELIEAGVKICVTEMDVSVLPAAWDVSADITRREDYEEKYDPYRSGLPEKKSAELSKRYAEYFRFFLQKAKYIDRVTVWGVTDEQSWLNDFPVKGRTDYPLFFDREARPKPVVADLVKQVKAWRTRNATDKDIAAKVRDIDGDGVIRVACVGDSITAGVHDSNYPMYLAEYLKALGAKNGKKYEVRNHGKGGAAVGHKREKIDVNGDGVKDDYFYYDDARYLSSLEYTPDVVIVQIGTNNAVYDGWWTWKDYFDKDFEEYFIKPYCEKGSLIVVSTPPYAHNRLHDYTVNGEVHDLIVELARKLKLPMVDMNALLYGFDEGLADGLHGNVTGYSQMALNFYRHVFGGTVSKLEVTGRPGTRVTLLDIKTKLPYTRIVGETGRAVFAFVPGSYEFLMTAELPGYKKTVENVKFASDGAKIALRQKPGDINLAVDAKPMQCDSKIYGSNHCKNLNDGRRTSGGYQPDHWKEGDWCGLTFEKPVEGHSLVFYWETEAFVSTYSDNGYEVYVSKNGEWKNLETFGAVKVTRDPYSGAVIADTVPISKAGAIDAVKVVFKNGKCSHTFAPKMYEMEFLTDVVR